MIIDSHQHFWKYNAAKHFWIPEEMSSIRKDFLPEDLCPVLKRNDIDGCLAVQVEHNDQETEFLLDCAAEYDFIKGVVGWVDLSADNLPERLEKYRSTRLKGFRHTEYDEKGEFLLRPPFRKGIGQLQDFGFTFDLLVFPHQLEAAIELVKGYPGQSFVMNHLGKPAISEGPSREWANLVKQLGAFENVSAKISGMVTGAGNLKWKPGDFDPFLDVMLDAFGANRVMFGSDWPVCTSAATYEEVYGLIDTFTRDFTKTERQALFGGNAMRLYSL